MKLILARDEHFAWMLGEAEAPGGLRLPPGGVDEPWVLRWGRRGLRERDGRDGWLMVEDGEVVGLCSHKGLPNDAGEVEIGYGVAPDHRRKGHATSAVALILAAARQDARLHAITAETAVANRPSQRVLEANGFAPVGRSHDDDEGETIIWRLDLPPPS